MLVQTFQRMPDGFRLSYEGYVHDGGETNCVLEEVFHFLASEERPNRLIRPALAVGDLITLFGGPRRLHQTYLICPGTSFKGVTYRFASIPERLAYKVEQRNSGATDIVRIPRSRS